MSLNFDGHGRDIALVKGGILNNSIVSVSKDIKKGIDVFEQYTLKNGSFEYIPNIDAENPDAVFVTGCRGSGKSHWASEYVIKYTKMFPKNKIFLFSEAEEDPLFDKIKKVKRIKIDESLLDDPIEWSEFKKNDSMDGCCVIFDDVDALTGKLGKYIWALRDKLLKNGRKFGISVVTTNHNCTGIELKSVLNESNVIVFFLDNYNGSLQYLLNKYIGIKKEDHVYKLIQNGSRATIYIKTRPNVILQERNIYTFNGLVMDKKDK